MAELNDCCQTFGGPSNRGTGRWDGRPRSTSARRAARPQHRVPVRGATRGRSRVFSRRAEDNADWLGARDRNWLVIRRSVSGGQGVPRPESAG